MFAEADGQGDARVFGLIQMILEEPAVKTVIEKVVNNLMRAAVHGRCSFQFTTGRYL